VIHGNGDTDTIHGDGGNDTIRAGTGWDTVHGGAGDDLIYGEAGEDKLYGNADDDRIYGGEHNDTIYGGSGDDTAHGNAGTDYLYGDDWFGPQGNDHLLGGDGEDWLYGRGGDDILNGMGWSDHIYGGSGEDTLLGGFGHDKLYGEGDVDKLTGGPGRDHFDGGAMRDELVDVTSEDSVEKTVHANLTIDSLYAIEASDGSLFESTNEVYFLVQGRERRISFGPVAVHPGGKSGWSMDTGDRVENISLWQGDLKPGESVDLTISMYDDDTGGPFGFLFGDDLLGRFILHIENVDGAITANWWASDHAVLKGVSSSSAGESADFHTWSGDGEFRVRTSVLEA
jgi:Ca2+-binding RTX toxin-like protein